MSHSWNYVGKFIAQYKVLCFCFGERAVSIGSMVIFKTYKVFLTVDFVRCFIGLLSVILFFIFSASTSSGCPNVICACNMTAPSEQFFYQHRDRFLSKIKKTMVCTDLIFYLKTFMRLKYGRQLFWWALPSSDVGWYDHPVTCWDPNIVSQDNSKDVVSVWIVHSLSYKGTKLS